MITKGPGAAAPASASDIPQNIEIGLYFKKAAAWEEMLSKGASIGKMYTFRLVE